MMQGMLTSRRRIVLVVIAVALVLVAIGRCNSMKKPEPPPDAGATTTRPVPPPDGGAVGELPPVAGMGGLPQASTGLPQSITVDLQRAPALSADPVKRAVALTEVYRTGDQAVGDIGVLGDDGKLRALDVVRLAAVSDEGGNAHSPFSPTVLSPSGTKAAFPQRDFVLLVDLTRAKVQTLGVPGYNEFVRWLGEDIYVAQGAKSFRIDATNRVTPSDLPATGLAASTSAQQRVELFALDRLPAARVHPPGTDRTIGPLRPGGMAQANWVPYGWVHNGRLAVIAQGTGASAGADSTGRADVLVVIDLATGTVHRELVLSGTGAGRRAVGCCTVLGWLNSQTVLLDVPVPEHWVLAWHTADRNFTKVTQVLPFGQTVGLSLAVSG